MTLEERKQSVLDRFAGIDGWEEKYAVLSSLINDVMDFPNERKKDENLVSGCSSKAWLVIDCVDGVLQMYSDADSQLVGGVLALLSLVVSGSTPEEILEEDFGFVNELEVPEILTPSRAGGLVSAVKMVKAFALVYQQKNKYES